MVKAKDLLKKTKKDEVDEDVLEEEKEDEEEEEELSASAKKYEPEENSEDEEEKKEDEDSDKEKPEELEEEELAEEDDDSKDEEKDEDIEPVKTPGGKIAMTEEDEEKVREVVNKGVDLDEDFDRPIKEERTFADMKDDSDKDEDMISEKPGEEGDPIPEEVEEKRIAAKEQNFDDLVDEEPIKKSTDLEDETFPSTTGKPNVSSGYFRENSEELPKDDSSIPHLGSMRSSQVPSSGLYAGGRGNERSPSGSKWHVLILLIIGLAVIGATVYLLKGNIGMPSFLQQAIATPSPTPVNEVIVENPTPTPGPNIDRAKYKIRVLNGTSTSGLAASASTKLKDLGYQIDRTGNATNSAFTQTVVRVKEGSESAALFEQIVKDLSSDFSAIASTILRAADAADAEVILGSK